VVRASAQLNTPDSSASTEWQRSFTPVRLALAFAGGIAVHKSARLDTADLLTGRDNSEQNYNDLGRFGRASVEQSYLA
jgi:hypothetical protein